jgi:DNA invertase Pin-like site-specific DNA recombinase
MPDQATPTRAALYVRMSKESQVYSILNQTAAVTAYAVEHGFEIVRTYSDQGISGLHLEGRSGLNDLLGDVLGGRADFTTILVYDVSRWGRFLDPDESAHYEFICRRAGVHVEYCAESFDNDNSLASVIAKHLRRAGAAEFSRDLSKRVSASKRRIQSEGFWGGGPAPIGLRRLLINADRSPFMILEQGERKALQSQRVILTPGPAEEQATVRRIFSLYADQRLTTPAIAERLQAEGVSPGTARTWNATFVRLILRNTLYIGRFIGHRYGAELGQKCRKLPSETWVAVENFVEPILDPRLFERAQRRMGLGPLRLTDEEMIDGLRRLRGKVGELSARAIRNDPDLPGPASFRTRFGSLPAAIARAGVKRPRNCASPRMGPFAGRLAGLLEANLRQPTAKRPLGTELYKILAREGYEGTLNTVRVHVRAWRRARSLALQPRSKTLEESALLDGLARILRAHGRLHTDLINADRDLPCVRIYARTFGSLREAYRRVGYAPARLYERPKLGPFLTRLDALIAANADAAPTSQMSAAALWRVLRSEGFQGGPALVERHCRLRRRDQRDPPTLACPQGG